jgi:hypothetical protein
MSRHLAIVLSVVMSVIGCDDVSNDTPAAVLPAPVIVEHIVPAEPPQATIENTNSRLEAVRKKMLDTKISPDMLKDIDLYVAAETTDSAITLDNVVLRPANKMQLTVMPRLFLKDDDQIKETYMDYLDGAAVEVKVKFD